jgi:hypothetical protein
MELVFVCWVLTRSLSLRSETHFCKRPSDFANSQFLCLTRTHYLSHLANINYFRVIKFNLYIGSRFLLFSFVLLVLFHKHTYCKVNTYCSTVEYTMCCYWYVCVGPWNLSQIYISYFTVLVMWLGIALSASYRIIRLKREIWHSSIEMCSKRFDRKYVPLYHSICYNISFSCVSPIFTKAMRACKYLIYLNIIISGGMRY